MAKLQEHADSADHGIQISGEPDTNTTDAQILVRETTPAFDGMACTNLFIKENLGYKPVRPPSCAHLGV